MTILSRVKDKLKKYPLHLLPKNDIDAWSLYDEYNFVYNKMFICQYQNISCAPVPITPKKFPVVVKPIINLYGMGIYSMKINDISEYNKLWNNTSFWMEYFEGPVQSWDIVIRNGMIIYHTYWNGCNDINHMGKFDYWEWKSEHNMNNNNNVITLNLIMKFVTDNLKKFTGTLNVETINNKIIEVHLRMGDIDQLPYDIVYASVANTVKSHPKYDKCIKKLFDNLVDNKYDTLYLVPVWQQINMQINLDEIYTHLKTIWEDIIINDDNITFYYFDKPHYSTPVNWKRWFLFRTCDLKHVMNMRNSIENNLGEKFISE